MIDVVRAAAYENSSNFKPDHLWPYCGQACEMQLNEKKTSMDNRKTQARCKENMENAREKLESPMKAAMYAL